MSSDSSQRGFTLIETMIVVAIIAILSSVAYPSYVEHVARGRRAEAKAALMEASHYMQRYYLANDRYDRDKAGNAFELPAAMSVVPRSGGAKTYTIQSVAANLSDTTFLLEARPQVKDACGILRIDERGTRTVSDADAGMTASTCWR